MSSNPQDELWNLLVYNVSHIKGLSERTFAPFTIKMKSEKKNEMPTNAINFLTEFHFIIEH